MKRQFTKNQQEEIADRDGCCQLCGTCENLDKTHHIYFGTHTPQGWVKGDDINGIWNGVLLCRFCHQGFHHTAKFGNGKNLKFNRQLLEKIGQKRYDDKNSKL